MRTLPSPFLLPPSLLSEKAMVGVSEKALQVIGIYFSKYRYFEIVWFLSSVYDESIIFVWIYLYLLICTVFLEDVCSEIQM